MAKNNQLNKAKVDQNDEFYTRLEDIEQELRYYKHHFKDKVVFCNCDDPVHSNFWKYFQLNFHHLGLKKLISTHYIEQGRSYKLEITQKEGSDGQLEIPDYIQTDLEGNGDFRSEECIEILKEADIVVTNPPFSLFREYILLLLQYDKKFIILGNQNATETKEIFPLIKNNIVWLGYKCGDMAFKVPSYYPERETRFWIDETGQKWRSLGNICWFTNLDIDKRHEKILLYKPYDQAEYPKYDNYNAIEVKYVKEIPCDYTGVMGVPVTFLDKYNPDQFEIIGHTHSADLSEEVEALRTSDTDRHRGMLNGKQVYARILIKRKDI